MIGRVALLHRTGELVIGDVAVLVAVAAPHRAEAFDAARFCIDTVKAAVPIWKHERWAGGDGWGTDAHPIEAVPAGTNANPVTTSQTESERGQHDAPASDPATRHGTSPVDS
jgi:molybdopterin synthase catalytic subunit